jgi:hypothetical protein
MTGPLISNVCQFLDGSITCTQSGNAYQQCWINKIQGIDRERQRGGGGKCAKLKCVLGNWGQVVESLVLAGEVVVVHRLGWADKLRDPREHSRTLVTLKVWVKL